MPPRPRLFLQTINPWDLKNIFCNKSVKEKNWPHFQHMAQLDYLTKKQKNKVYLSDFTGWGFFHVFFCFLCDYLFLLFHIQMYTFLKIANSGLVRVKQNFGCAFDDNL